MKSRENAPKASPFPKLVIREWAQHVEIMNEKEKEEQIYFKVVISIKLFTSMLLFCIMFHACLPQWNLATAY